MAKQLLLTIFLIGFSSSGLAGMRCGNELIQLGDNFARVEDVCGEPDSNYHVGTKYVEQTRRDRFGNEATLTQAILVDVWVYKGSSSKFTRTLYFENGVLVDIDLGERG
jgi:hypothetical protein